MLLQANNGYICLNRGQDLQLNGGANGSIGGSEMTSHGSGINVAPDAAYPVNVTGTAAACTPSNTTCHTRSGAELWTAP